MDDTQRSDEEGKSHKPRLYTLILALLDHLSKPDSLPVLLLTCWPTQSHPLAFPEPPLPCFWQEEARLLSHFSRVRLLCNPIDGSPPGSPLGFSRQEHWSGLPFPSPMPESEKWKWSRSVVSDPQQPHGPQPSRLLRPWRLISYYKPNYLWSYSGPGIWANSFIGQSAESQNIKK